MHIVAISIACLYITRSYAVQTILGRELRKFR
jgi:hypothetical protein